MTAVSTELLKRTKDRLIDHSYTRSVLLAFRLCYRGDILVLSWRQSLLTYRLTTTETVAPNIQ
jgi:hypothetical protein